jgi:hypothetical protein
LGALLALSLAALPPWVAASATTDREPCTAAPLVRWIGPFATTPGDCLLAYAVSDEEMAAWARHPQHLPFRTRLLDDLDTHLGFGFDLVLVVVPHPPAGLPFDGTNYPGAECVPGVSGCDRHPVLGTVVLVGLDALSQGPSLHEILHGYTGAVQGTLRSLVPTTVPAHWGFSSVGGQLGGWSSSTLRPLADGLWQASRPDPQAAGLAQQQGWFGEVANGGNSVPYAPLELFLMGLLPAAQLPPVTYAEAPEWVDPARGIFSARSLRTLQPAEIAARLDAQQAAFLTRAPRHVRTVVVLVNATGTAATQDVAALRHDIAQFARRGPPTAWIAGAGKPLFNFWTATGAAATLDVDDLSRRSRRAPGQPDAP